MFLFETPEGQFVAVFVLFMMTTFFSWIGFARLSMARIERRMQKEGLPCPSSWDGLGLRVLWYASAIAFPVGAFNRANDPFIDVLTVRRYSTRFDRILGSVLMVSGFLFLIVGLLGGLVFDFY